MTCATAQAADYPSVKEVQKKLAKVDGAVFEIGSPNVAYEKYFTGQTFLAPLAKDLMGVSRRTHFLA